MITDKIFFGIMLTAAGILMILFLKFARKNPKEWFWAIRKRDFINFLDFAVKLQPDENRGLLNRRKKREKEQQRG
jgi:hypothetical protein